MQGGLVICELYEGITYSKIYGIAAKEHHGQRQMEVTGKIRRGKGRDPGKRKPYPKGAPVSQEALAEVLLLPELQRSPM